jgi:glutamyl-tRNA synthetase
MDWGNAIVRSKTIDGSGTVTAIEMVLHLEGDFKKTKKKITWLSQSTAEHPLVSVTLLDHDYLITKKKLEEDDVLEDVVTPVSEYVQLALADANVSDLKKGDVMQFERKGYYMCDGKGDSGRIEFIRVPDGKAANLASKAGAGGTGGAVTASATPQAPPTTMYPIEPIYGTHAQADTSNVKMYEIDSIHKS